MNRIMESVTTIAAAIIGLAMLAVIVGRQSRTSAVIDSASKGFIGSLIAAESPVTGNNSTFGINYGGGNSFLDMYPNAGIGTM